MRSQTCQRAPSGARILSGATALALAVIAGLFADIVRAESGLESEVRACSTLVDKETRLACFDAAVARLPRSGTSEPTASAGSPGTPAAPQSRTESSASTEPVPEVARVEARIERLARQPRGEQIFYLSNGEIWVELEPRRTRYQPGMRITIERTLSGGYTLFTETGGATRVRRLP